MLLLQTGQGIFPLLTNRCRQAEQKTCRQSKTRASSILLKHTGQSASGLYRDCGLSEVEGPGTAALDAPLGGGGGTDGPGADAMGLWTGATGAGVARVWTLDSGSLGDGRDETLGGRGGPGADGAVGAGGWRGAGAGLWLAPRLLVALSVAMMEIWKSGFTGGGLYTDGGGCVVTGGDSGGAVGVACL